MCVCVRGGGGGGGKEAEGRLIGHRQEINRALQYTIFKGGKRTCRNEEACEMTKFMWQHIHIEVLLKFH